MTPAGFPHSDTPGSTLGCQLPRAYRRLLRPSSALDAKASTMCPSQLVTHTTNPTPTTATHPPTNPPTGRPEDRQTTTARDQTRDAHNQATKNHKHDQGQSPRPHQHTNKQPRHPTPHHQTPRPLPKKKTKDPAQGTPARGYKMLASTIQISNNNPTLPTTSTHPRTTAGSRARSPRHPHPDRTQRTRQERPDSSEPQQRVCQQTKTVCFHISKTPPTPAHERHRNSGVCSLERR
jgi:hypothetical protein